MGAVLGKQMEKAMDENMKKQQDFMLSSQKMQLERQIQMQLQMRQRMIATQLSLTRERMYWWGGFTSLTTLVLIAGYVKTKHPAVLLPLLPLGFVVGYQADMAWGNKMDRVIAEADRIVAKEQHLLEMPGPALSVSLIDQERKKSKA